MKALGDYLLNSIPSARIERKFMMSSGQSYKAMLLFNEYGFRKAYPDRKVCSYYFDTIDFEALRDNIDGVNVRDKLRARYYDDDFDTARIEIKHKRGDVGYKSIFDTEGDIPNEKMLIKNVSDWCSNYVKKKLMATVCVTYNRRYYERQWLRVTFDTKIKGYRTVHSNLIKSSMRNYEVVEFKYPVERDNDFRSIYKEIDSFSLRNTKSSKYSNALMY